MRETVVTAVACGRRGVGALLRQPVRCRVHPGWYAVALLGPVVMLGVPVLVSLALAAPVKGLGRGRRRRAGRRDNNRWAARHLRRVRRRAPDAHEARRSPHRRGRSVWRPPTWLVRLVLGPQMAFLLRSQRVSNRRFTAATGWAARVRSAADGLPRLARDWRRWAADRPRAVSGNTSGGSVDTRSR